MAQKEKEIRKKGETAKEKEDKVKRDQAKRKKEEKKKSQKKKLKTIGVFIAIVVVASVFAFLILFQPRASEEAKEKVITEAEEVIIGPEIEKFIGEKIEAEIAGIEQGIKKLIEEKAAKVEIEGIVRRVIKSEMTRIEKKLTELMPEMRELIERKVEKEGKRIEERLLAKLGKARGPLPPSELEILEVDPSYGIVEVKLPSKWRALGFRLKFSKEIKTSLEESKTLVIFPGETKIELFLPAGDVEIEVRPFIITEFGNQEIPQLIRKKTIRRDFRVRDGLGWKMEICARSRKIGIGPLRIGIGKKRLKIIFKK